MTQTVEAIAIRVPETGLSEEAAQSLKASFAGYFEKADEWRTKALAIHITDVSQTREMKLARETRLALREIRVDAEKTRKQLKEDSLRRGKAIDGIYNMLEFAIKPLEDHLHEQEKFVERAEAERKAKLAESRAHQLAAYDVDCSLYQLGDISEDSFKTLLETNRLAHEARIETARKAEAERIAREKAEADERERIRVENTRLKQEAEKREAEIAAERRKQEAALQAEREKAEAARKAAEAKARAEREAVEKKARAEREKAAREAAEAKARADAAEAALRAKQREEARVKEAEAKARASAARAPDKSKVLAFAKSVRALPTITAATDEGKATAAEIAEKVESFAKWIESKAATL